MATSTAAARADDPPKFKMAGSDLKPLDLAAVTSQRLDRHWPAFEHGPIATSGFNALMLPMKNADAEQIGNAAEANAFGFLLSDDLDFSPASYNTRHACFVCALPK